MKSTQFTYDTAWKAVGGLSEPSKMPCHGWSVSAFRCKMGGKLRKVAGSVCSGCYATRNNYLYKTVQACLERRFKALHTPAFVPAFVYLLKVLQPRYFRLYDSGDLDTVQTLKKWVAIAEACPDVKFWLPTKEYAIVTAYLKAGGIIPLNMNVRLSAYMVDESGPITLATRLGLTISEVSKVGYNCPASTQGNKCLDCRKCWDRNVFAVVYKKH